MGDSTFSPVKEKFIKDFLHKCAQFGLTPKQATALARQNIINAKHAADMLNKYADGGLADLVKGVGMLGIALPVGAYVGGSRLGDAAAHMMAKTYPSHEDMQKMDNLVELENLKKQIENRTKMLQTIAKDQDEGRRRPLF